MKVDRESIERAIFGSPEFDQLAARVSAIQREYGVHIHMDLNVVDSIDVCLFCQEMRNGAP